MGIWSTIGGLWLSNEVNTPKHWEDLSTLHWEDWGESSFSLIAKIITPLWIVIGGLWQYQYDVNWEDRTVNKWEDWN